MDFLNRVQRGRNNLWIYILTSLVLFIPYLKKTFATTFPERYKASFLYDINKNFSFLNDVYTSIIYLLILFLSVNFLHKRNVVTIFTGRKKFDFLRFTMAVSLFGFFTMLMFLIEYLRRPLDFVYIFDNVQSFIPHAIKTFFQILVIVMLPDLLFRGYLLQLFALLTKNRIAAILISALLYVLLNFFSPIANFLGYPLLLFYFYISIYHAIIAVVDDGLELALGVHTSNNVMLLLLCSYKWAGKGNTLFFDKSSAPNDFFMFYLPMLFIYPLSLVVFSKMYNWKWKQKILNKL